MSKQRQTFGSALKRPWALVLHGPTTPGRRPSTSVCYLTDDEGDYYLGGFVWFGREMFVTDERHLHRDRYPCWHYRYKYQHRIAKADIVEIFSSTDKSKLGGPLLTEIRAAKRALRPTPPPEEPVKVVIPITWSPDE